MKLGVTVSIDPISEDFQSLGDVIESLQRAVVVPEVKSLVKSPKSWRLIAWLMVASLSVLRSKSGLQVWVFVRFGRLMHAPFAFLSLRHLDPCTLPSKMSGLRFCVQHPGEAIFFGNQAG